MDKYTLIDVYHTPHRTFSNLEEFSSFLENCMKDIDPSYSRASARLECENRNEILNTSTKILNSNTMSSTVEWVNKDYFTKYDKKTAYSSEEFFDLMEAHNIIFKRVEYKY